MAILSLCSGVGMLDVAVEHITGEKTAYVAEKDPAAAAVLALRFPQVSNLGDIEGFDWAAWAADHPEITVIAAGFSCQDISNAGPREGISGSRSSVWKDVARAVGHVRPRVAFLENVGAIRSRGLNVVAEDLAEVGYDLRWTTLRASDTVGAAHQRLRWFGIATPHAPDADGVGLDGDGELPEGRDSVRVGLRQDADGCDQTPADAGSEGLEVGGLEPARDQLPPAERGDPAPEDADGEPRDERVLAAPRQTAGGGVMDPRSMTRSLTYFPTPTTSDGTGGPGTSPHRKGGMNLRTAVTHLPSGGASTCPPSDDGS